MTNATKALVISVLNAALGVAVVFGVSITEVQTGAIMVLANSVGALVVALTYKRSAKRIPDDGFVLTLDPDQE
jgi:hypothetical protein